MDGDLQHPPELIPELVKAWKQGAPVVETRRHYNAQTNRFKQFSSALFYRFFSLVSEIDMEEGRSDFRLIDRRVLDQVLAFQQSDIFLRGVASWHFRRSRSGLVLRWDWSPARSLSWNCVTSWRNMYWGTRCRGGPPPWVSWCFSS